MTTPTIPGSFVVQQNDPPGCIHILGPEPQNRFIARIEEGTMEDAFLLAASRDMLAALSGLIHDIEHEIEPHGRMIYGIENAKAVIAEIPDPHPHPPAS